MNTLVALGASAAFGVSCVAAGLTGLGWRTFFEEPAMLLGFVLVGRTLEERAKLQASSDLVALQVLACCYASDGNQCCSMDPLMHELSHSAHCSQTPVPMHPSMSV